MSIDATGVRQQGEQGAVAEGRMACVAMVYNPRGADRTLQRRSASVPHQVRYLAGFYELNALGIELRGQAAQVGWDEAEQQIAISDGGSGMEDFLRKNFPLATVILDFWHAKEHLVELGKAHYGEGSAVGEQWLGDRCHQLKAEGGAASLEALDVSAKSEALCEVYRQETNYFRLLPQPRAQVGLSALRESGLADRVGSRGKRLQDGSQQSPCRQWNALGFTGQQCRLPPPRPLSQPTQPVGSLLERLPKLTTNVTLTSLWRKYPVEHLH